AQFVSGGQGRERSSLLDRRLAVLGRGKRFKMQRLASERGKRQRECKHRRDPGDFAAGQELKQLSPPTCHRTPFSPWDAGGGLYAGCAGKTIGKCMSGSHQRASRIFGATERSHATSEDACATQRGASVPACPCIHASGRPLLVLRFTFFCVASS